uniref:Telomeric repeat-binding factor 2-interacting protein 1 n=1 Tax=Kryptolebias marmoratus TaxID=37003 RepID=A0A3Q3AQ20_KRYMA
QILALAVGVDPVNPAPSLSPVLFMTVDAGPMNFFLRPGPVKRKLQPLITAGGGVMCSVQKSGAILLIDPEEKSSVPQSAAHWYVSTQYIYDCVEKEEQLNLEDYRFNPEVVLRHSPRLNSSKQVADGLSGGRLVYTPEDDAAILDFVNKQKKKTGGNRLWQEMEKRRVTSHSWQSMKSRYRNLRNRSETAAALTESQPKPSDTSAEPTSEQSKPETEPGPRENLPEPQASSDRDSPDAAAAAPAGSEPGGAASKAHLFIFDSESQEEESQSVLAVGPAAPSNPQPTAGKGAAFSLTQDFVSVTKALLKTSGYFSAALDLLLNPSSVSAPIWNRHDDSLLLSSDPAVRQKLQEKYGEENVAKRMVFLERKKKQS